MKQSLVLIRWKWISWYFRFRSLKMSAVYAHGKVSGGNIINKENQWIDFLIHSVLSFHLAFRFAAVPALSRPASQNSARFSLQSHTAQSGMVESILLHCLGFGGGTLLSSWHDMSSWHDVYMAWLSKCEGTSPRDRGSAAAPHPPLLHSSSRQLQPWVVESLKAGERRGSCGQLVVKKGQCEIVRTGDIRQQKRLCFSLGCPFSWRGKS